MDKQEFIQKMKDQPFSVLSDLVYQYIVDAIVEIRFPPGSKINTKRLSEELGISRTPIRTALERLVEQKLVEQVGEKGFRVCQIDWKDCMALYDIREMIESNAAYIAANSITEAQLEQLRFSILAAKKARANSDILALFEANNRFHDVIVLSTGNNYLIDMYESLKTWIHRYQHSLIAAQKYDINIDRQTSIDRHVVIYRAIKSRYSMVAKAEMKDYLHHIYRVLFDGGLVTRSPIGSED